MLLLFTLEAAGTEVNCFGLGVCSSATELAVAGCTALINSMAAIAAGLTKSEFHKLLVIFSSFPHTTFKLDFAIEQCLEKVNYLSKLTK